MPRIPYLPADVSEPADIVQAIRQRRGGTLLNLDRMLLHSSPLARGWSAFLREVRTGFALDSRLRELAICSVAALNGAAYEMHHHAPAFLAAGGTDAQLAAIRGGAVAVGDFSAFGADDRAVLQLVLEMTRQVAVRDATFDAVRHLLGDRGTVELVAVVSAYAMVSRFLVALGIDIEP